MAVTALWRIKGYLGNVLMYAQNPEKTTDAQPLKVQKGLNTDALEDVIAYAERDGATAEKQWVSGILCSPERARQEMMKVKKQWHKEDGTVAYHGYQSFAPGECTPEQAHNIGIELANELWGSKGYQVLVCTHLDKESHMHNHFVINTVSMDDGIKFHRTKEDYRQMRDVSDRLCREHGLSVIEKPQNRGKHYSEWDAEKNGKPTYRKMIMADIDRAIKASASDRDFFVWLEDMGYTINLTTKNGTERKHPTITPPNSKKNYRFDSLDPGYALEEIMDRILENIRFEVPFPEKEEEKVRKYRRDHPPHTKHKGFAALYYYYCYQLHIIVRFPTSVPRVSAFLREDIMKLDKLDEQARLLAENSIETIYDLNAYQVAAKEQIDALTGQRTTLRNELKRTLRTGDQAAVLVVKEKIAAVSDEIKRLRDSLEICDSVEQRAEQMKNELDEIQYETEKEVESDELFGRSSGTGREDVT